MTDFSMLPCPGLEHAPMSQRTTFKLGGAARVLLEPHAEAQLAAALAWVKAEGLPLFVLGRGSNLVVSDAGWPGAIIALSANFAGVRWTENGATALAGTRLTEFVTQGVGRGLAGLEKLAGIPGTVGGAVFINAGAYGQEFGDRVVRVTSVSRDGIWLERSREECAFAYRHSAFKDNGEIVVSATVELTTENVDTLRATVREIQRMRVDKQPLDLPNAGSLFKRPPGGFASKMVEEAGLKGFRVGNAAISEKHAGFAVNLGGATAADVWNLSSEVIERVKASHGVILEREVIFLGDFTGSATGAFQG
ncbi:MAG: UDP-N-acetylmuramate dehydrogenase [Fibrobacterota bacterium]